MTRKSCIGFGVLLLMTAGSDLYAQDAVSLDEGIIQGAGRIKTELEQAVKLKPPTTLKPGETVKLVVVNFKSPTERFAEYILNELVESLMNREHLAVVTREEMMMEMLKQELDYQKSGDVSDESALSVAAALGAQFFVSGSAENMGSFYRLRFRVFSVETRQISVGFSINVRKDDLIALLLGETPGSPPPVPAPAPAPRTPSQPSGVGARVGYAALNLALGLGSYLQGDWGAGIILTAGYAAAAGLIVWEVAGLKYEDDLAGVPGAIGLVVAGGTAIFGFIKPFLVKNDTSKAAALLKGLNIVPVSANEGNGRLKGFGITYTYQF